MAAGAAARAPRGQPQPAAPARVAHDQVPRARAVPAAGAHVPTAAAPPRAPDRPRPPPADGQLGGAWLVPRELAAGDRGDPELRPARDDGRRGECGAPDI